MALVVVPRSTKDQSPRRIVGRRGPQLSLDERLDVAPAITYASTGYSNVWKLNVALCTPALERFWREAQQPSGLLFGQQDRSFGLVAHRLPSCSRLVGRFGGVQHLAALLKRVMK